MLRKYTLFYNVRSYRNDLIASANDVFGFYVRVSGLRKDESKGSPTNVLHARKSYGQLSMNMREEPRWVIISVAEFVLSLRSVSQTNIRANWLVFDFFFSRGIFFIISSHMLDMDNFEHLFTTERNRYTQYSILIIWKIKRYKKNDGNCRKERRTFCFHQSPNLN